MNIKFYRSVTERLTVLFGRNEEGVALIEFAASIGFLMLVFFGTIELSHYIITVQKLEKTVATVANVSTQITPAGLTMPSLASQMNTLFSYTDMVMSPYNFTATGVIIVSDITCAASGQAPPSGPPCPNTGTGANNNLTLNWQCVSTNVPAGLSPAAVATQIYSVGTNGVHLPDSFPTHQIDPNNSPPDDGTFISLLNVGEEFVVVEGYYNFQPFTKMIVPVNSLATAPIYRTFVFVPRNGSLAVSGSASSGNMACNAG